MTEDAKLHAGFKTLSTMPDFPTVFPGMAAVLTFIRPVPVMQKPKTKKAAARVEADRLIRQRRIREALALLDQDAARYPHWVALFAEAYAQRLSELKAGGA